MPAPIRVCFVCLGNICRSPTAEGVFRHLVQAAGVSERFEVDSAGTAAYHAGEPPDRRSAQTAADRGVPLSGRARQFVAEDFSEFDYVVAMDSDNYDALCRLKPHDDQGGTLSMLRDHDPQSAAGSDVPDPYYGGRDGFSDVFDICTAGCRGLLLRITKTHGL